MLAHHDKLTGLPSRIGLDGFFPNERKLIVEKNRQIAVLYLDLDGFKGINDNLGHHMGDLLLKEAANQLTGCIRSDAFAARIGGDEFVVAIRKAGRKRWRCPSLLPTGLFQSLIRSSKWRGIV
ncbi:diguanylate cyclase (GGDEF) domain-containing protein [Propionispora hippei DSM 15287]|uniref:Diguanylate cyclase (GGDEF) domain-containing protein n=1 Tax=Propionispora hippei DSM 15287 TaxID=1123003 RepID=A0A1M6NZF8_9FIRM|nr:diguanylate cyclase (GGDEF) domain-containing protein [Propionispora hippei DSM 15287]